jgi:hypothetical protein
MERPNLKAASMVLFLAGGLCAIPMAARSDLTLETRIDNKTQRTYIAPHLLSAEVDNGGLVFRGDKQILWILNAKEKSYTEMTEADAKALSEKVSQAMTQVQEAMKNVPPEQREMVEKMMKGKLDVPQEVKRTVKPTGEVKEINGFRCTGYTATRSDGSSAEVWTADLKAANIQPEDLGVFKDLGSFMGSLMPQMGSFQEMIKDYEHPSDSDVPGFPVLTIERDKGGHELRRAEVVSIGHDKVPETRFVVPSDYKKVKMPGTE